jgi:hypothetical protein
MGLSPLDIIECIFKLTLSAAGLVKRIEKRAALSDDQLGGSGILNEMHSTSSR